MTYWRQEKQKQLEEELHSHLEMSTRDHVDRGESPAQAELSARREFGNVALVEHVIRDQWALLWLDDLLQDIRYGARMLRKNPGFALIAAFILALGIGANTAIFSLVSGILLQPLPYPHPEELVSVAGCVSATSDSCTYPQGGLAAMREQIRTMDVAAYAEGYEFNLTGLGEPIRLAGTPVSAELFTVLGAQPELGRTFRKGEDLAGQSSFVILSHSLWQRKFASDPNVLGRVINLAGVPRQIVGVMPPAFRFPSAQTEVWIPLNIDSRNTPTYWAGDYMPVIGRLRPGATMQQASAEIAVFQSRVVKLFPWPMPPDWNAGVSVVSLQTGIVTDVRSRLLILFAAVALVLLIACANVANLTLSRAAVRVKEIAIRTSLGAARHRVVRQLLTESVLLSAVGGTFGVLLAATGLSLLRSTLPAGTPRLSDVTIDWRVLLFTAALVIFTGVLSGLAPAFHSWRPDLNESLKSGSRGATQSGARRMRNVLVISELALAVLLVCAAGLLIRSLWSLSHIDPGFRSQGVLTARITPNESFCKDSGRCFSFYRDVLGQTRTLPGVNDAAIITTLPLDGRVQKRSISIEGRTPTSAEPEPLLWMNTVSPGYFSTMNIPVLRGREFTNADTSPGAHAIILSAETARRYWPNEDAVGKHIRFVDQNDWRTIVGIVADVRGYNLRENVPDWTKGAFYVPYGPGVTLEDGRVPAAMTLVIRSAGAQALEDPLRRIVASLNAEAPVTDVKPLRAILTGAASAPRSVTSLFAAFAALALVLGIVGIYGVISFFVGQRTREIGIRLALGAQRTDVLRLVVNEGLSLTAMGIAAGLAAAFGLTRYLGSMLYGVSPTDPLDFAAVALLFALVALAACYIPARRAMRVDPLVALRYE
jgi:putative ABC transport system permease protein